MKKIVTLLASLTLLVGLMAACGSKAADTSASSSATTATAATAATELKIQASAKTFQFDKPEYHVKKGEAVKITLVNLDGVHGVDIQALGVKLEGNKLSQTVTPDKAGTYDIICAVPCGAGHMNMKSKLIVD